ncbi:MAG: hypothetical protein N2248_00450 [candidate division WOR-3 bacterium]|nr:hypothetical protein [candidate division WOR-3 bacterium]
MSTERPNLTTVKLPSGKTVALGPRFGELSLQVDLDFATDPKMASLDPEERRGWKGLEIIARTIKMIDGKPVTRYTRDDLIRNFPERDIAVLVVARARLDTPTPEELAAALSDLESAAALAESVEIHRLTGGAISFEISMQFSERKRKLLLSALRRELEQLQPPESEK